MVYLIRKDLVTILDQMIKQMDNKVKSKVFLLGKFN